MNIIRRIFWFLFPPTHRHRKERRLMKSIAELQVAVSAVNTAKDNVASAASALIGSISTPVPDSVVDSLNGTASALESVAANLTAAIPPAN